MAILLTIGGPGPKVIIAAISGNLNHAPPALIGGAVASQSIVAIVFAVVVVVFGFILLGLIQSSLHGIYAAALYRYAESGEASVGFDQGLLEQAFRSKQK